MKKNKIRDHELVTIPAGMAKDAHGFYKKHGRFGKIMIWIGLSLLVILMISSLAGTDTESTASNPTPTVTKTHEAVSPEPVQTTNPEPTPEPEVTEEEVPEVDLATDVEEALLSGNAVSDFQQLNPTSPGFWISEIESTNSSTIRVHIAADLTDTERDQTARWVSNMACTTVADLETIIVRDTSGRDSNHYVNRMSPMCD